MLNSFSLRLTIASISDGATEEQRTPRIDSSDGWTPPGRHSTERRCCCCPAIRHGVRRRIGEPVTGPICPLANWQLGRRFQQQNVMSIFRVENKHTPPRRNAALISADVCLGWRMRATRLLVMSYVKKTQYGWNGEIVCAPPFARWRTAMLNIRGDCVRTSIRQMANGDTKRLNLEVFVYMTQNFQILG